MKVDEILLYNDVYSPLKPVAWLDRIEKIREGELVPPTFIQLHPEGSCNHRCISCAYRESGWTEHGMKFHPGMRIPKEIALDLPRQMSDEGIEAIELTGSGEPLLYPWITDLLRACDRYLEDIAIVTNGEKVTKHILECMSSLSWIRFSIDAATPDTYRKIHRVDAFEKVIDNLIITRDAFPDAVLGVSYIVLKENLGEIVQAARLFKKLGADNIRYTFEYAPKFKLSEDELARADRRIQWAKREVEGRGFRIFGGVDRVQYYTKPNDDFTFCGYQMFSWNVGADAKCYPCCIQIYHEGYDFGDLTKESLHDIIYGDRRRKYIEEFDVKKCWWCWMRTKNFIIETLLKPDRRLGHVRYV